MQAQETMQGPGLSLSLSFSGRAQLPTHLPRQTAQGFQKQLSGQSLGGWAQFLGPLEGARTLLPTAERGNVLIAVSKAQHLQEGIVSCGDINLVAGPQGQEYEKAW